MIWLMQTLLDTNVQLNPHTRHAQGLPVHWGFSDFKADGGLFRGEDANGKDVVEWRTAHNECECIYYASSPISLQRNYAQWWEQTNAFIKMQRKWFWYVWFYVSSFASATWHHGSCILQLNFFKLMQHRLRKCFKDLLTSWPCQFLLDAVLPKCTFSQTCAEMLKWCLWLAWPRCAFMTCSGKKLRHRDL